MQAQIRKLLFVAIAALYVVSVPWYRTPGSAPALWFGFPDWAVLALLCYALIAVLTAVSWWLTDIVDDGDAAAAGDNADAANGADGAANTAATNATPPQHRAAP